MHGHGHPPPPPRRPPTAVLVVLRVFFVAVALLSIGFLAWVAPLRAALVTHKRRDWWVFVGTLAAMGVSFSFLSTDHTDDFSSPNGNAGMIILLLNACACVGYYLYADIRHFQQPRYAGYIPPQHPAGAHGYPQPTAYAAPHMPQPRTPVPPPQPQPQRPAPARIDQVRAELDELSDYLRKHEGGR
ncbi:hypothetical protein [Streptomyces chiangmaiensis]|uniref:Integral membrane protein n=1 Tax=Streptomyces chiangmaiensis TaxID=766497 RepID=A0ABU7FBG7_9ACTN|nr:hypothetical protein [Streptomyces chiangmaiensis]MED7821224.1 hypothetical protein [Streptomyces chiangmaiensis]